MTFRSHPDYYALVKEALPGADFVGEENWYRAPAPKYCLPGDQCGDAHLTGGSGFVQIGNWRIGDVDDGDHFAISREYPGGSAAVFTSRGLAHKGNDRTSLPGTPFYEQAYTLGARKIMAQPQGIRVGDGFIEFNKKWRLWLTPDSKYLAVVHRSGTVAGAWYENDATGGRFLTGTGAPECPAEKDSNGFTYHHYEEHALTEINHGDVCRKGTPSSGGDWWRWECPTHCNKVAGLAQPYCTDKTSGAPCRKQDPAKRTSCTAFTYSEQRGSCKTFKSCPYLTKTNSDGKNYGLGKFDSETFVKGKFFFFLYLCHSFFFLFFFSHFPYDSSLTRFFTLFSLSYLSPSRFFVP